MTAKERRLVALAKDAIAGIANVENPMDKAGLAQFARDMRLIHGPVTNLLNAVLNGDVEGASDAERDLNAAVRQVVQNGGFHGFVLFHHPEWQDS